MKTVALLLLLAFHVRVAAGQSMPVNNNAPQWTLEKCLEYAITHNQDVLAQKQLVQAGMQDRKAAVTQLVPELSLKGAINNYWKIPVQVFPGELVNQPAGTFVPVRMGTPWMGNYGVDADLPLVDVQTWQRIKLARLQEQGAQAEYNSLLKTLLKNVRIAWYSVQQQQEYVTVTSGLQENYEHVHQLISRQFDKGLIDKIVLNQSATLLKNREAEHIKAVAGLQQSYLDLKFWMGFPLEDTLPVTPSDNLPELAVAGFRAEELPGYEAELLKVTTARQDYRSSLSAIYPSLHVKGSWEQLGFGDKSNFITRSPWFTVGFIGLQLSMPLSLSRTTYTPRSRKARWEAAGQQFKRYTSQQEKKYRQEKVLLEQAAENIRLQQENTRLATENEQLTTLKINKGIIDMIQLKEVQTDLYKAQEQLNEARMDFFRHYTEINYLQNK
ncbi:TolC family protein [Chitinophaga sp.]|uniref:TolC family protein n=1 Tax=Chitinophaga sp. TaxID=1869181 RepID=UPI002F9255CC